MPQTSINRTRTVALATSGAPADALSALHQFALDLVARTDLYDILACAVSTAAQITSASHATLLLLEPGGEQVRYRVALASGNLAPLELVARPMMQKGMAGWVARERRAAIVPDTASDPRWLPGPGSGDLRSALVAPLLAADQVLGVITLGHEAAGHFRPDQLNLLEIIGAQTALAIERARLADQPPAQLARAPAGYQPEPADQIAAVLVAELRGLSAAAAALPPAEGFGEVLGAFFQTARLVVGRQGGLIVGVSGDRLSAIFAGEAGAPAAALAAHELRSLALRLRERWQARFGLGIGALGCGIDYGQVTLGTLELDQPVTHMIGSAVDLAARLCELARGEILVSAQAARQLAGASQIRLEPLSPIQISGQPSQIIFHAALRGAEG